MTTPDIPTEALEAAARTLAELAYGGIRYAVNDGYRVEVAERHYTAARKIIAAAAPHLIAEGRRQAARDLEKYAGNYPEDVFLPHGTSTDSIAGTAMRHAYRNAAVIVIEGIDE